MSVDIVLSKLEGVRPNGRDQWMARCPAHGDKRASLSVRAVDDGRVLMHCFGGCNVGEVLGAIGMSIEDLFEKRLADGKPIKRNTFNALGVLRAISGEAMIVAMCGSRILDGTLSEADRDRMFLAVGRVESALDAAGVSRG